MAIQVSGTTVIDDSRNVTNAGSGSFSGTVSANSFSGSASGLTGIPQGTVTSVATSGAITGGTITTSGTITARNATTGQTGVVQLSTSISSTSTTLAATASAAKSAYDRGTTGVNDAATAQSTANTAQSTANTAQSTANTANSTANTANSNANTALGRTSTGKIHAWANWEANGTVRASQGLSSLSKVNTSRYKLNFSSTISNYAFAGGAGFNTGSNGAGMSVISLSQNAGSYSTTYLEVTNNFQNGGLQESPVASCAVFTTS